MITFNYIRLNEKYYTFVITDKELKDELKDLRLVTPRAKVLDTIEFTNKDNADKLLRSIIEHKIEHYEFRYYAGKVYGCFNADILGYADKKGTYIFEKVELSFSRRLKQLQKDNKIV